MDKIAANNLFVGLRKEIKKAKAMVSGNLIRKIAKHKKEKEKLEDADQVAKIDNKIAATLNEIKLLKTIDPYSISKKAIVKSDVEHWNKVVSDSKATVEEKLSARVIVKNNIQKQVAKFREDHTDCDEWINEYLEYREKKREIVNKPKKQKIRQLNPLSRHNRSREGRT